MGNANEHAGTDAAVSKRKGPFFPSVIAVRSFLVIHSFSSFSSAAFVCTSAVFAGTAANAAEGTEVASRTADKAADIAFQSFLFFILFAFLLSYCYSLF